MGQESVGHDPESRCKGGAGYQTGGADSQASGYEDDSGSRALGADSQESGHEDGTEEEQSGQDGSDDTESGEHGVTHRRASGTTRRAVAMREPATARAPRTAKSGCYNENGSRGIGALTTQGAVGDDQEGGYEDSAGSLFDGAHSEQFAWSNLRMVYVGRVGWGLYSALAQVYRSWIHVALLLIALMDLTAFPQGETLDVVSRMSRYVGSQ